MALHKNPERVCVCEAKVEVCGTGSSGPQQSKTDVLFNERKRRRGNGLMDLDGVS